MIRRIFSLCTALGVIILMGGVAHGKAISQSFTLNPGWNAIFLEVEPQSVEPGTVFEI